MNKIERQNKLVQAIETNDQLTASQLAKTLKVSKRTILRDIQDLEQQGVQIIAKQGMLGGYRIQQSHAPITLELTEDQMLALFMTLNESQSYSQLPYKKEIEQLIKKCLNQPATHIRRILKRMDRYIKFESNPNPTLPQTFSDLLIYCAERNVMLVEYEMNQQTFTENVIFIGLVCRHAEWRVVTFDIGHGHTKEIAIDAIHDISYSFHKTVKTHDITIYNYQQFLNSN
ncbi:MULTISPECIES: helix-turn-helix transcriptional regulator [Staphylococcus]|uniref:helix-turn-helix transcriptional regulator n=1 Tax=Staphylococcus TaxID=1279 RepID=UPI000D0258A7|nr:MULTISPECIES: HTH domain-containing protein [Staphylococcus]MCD8915723.1 HTH domain-containing protein [Staphylococcus simulans]UXV35596.1 HTH domain-containing protein [Staphylococcus sp. IVB6181]